MNESTTPPAWQPGDLVALELRGDSTPTRGTVVRADRTGVAVRWDDGEVTHLATEDAVRLERGYAADVAAPTWPTEAHTHSRTGWRRSTDAEASRAAEALGWTLDWVAQGEWLAAVPDSTARFVEREGSGEFHATVGEVHVRFTVRNR